METGGRQFTLLTASAQRIVDTMLT